MKPSVLDAEVFSSEYRLDILNKIEGGVLIAVINSLPSRRLLLSAEIDVDFIGVSLKLDGNVIFLSCLYILLTSDNNAY